MKKEITVVGDKEARAVYTTRLSENADKEWITTTFLDDLDYETVLVEFIVPHAKVRAQARYRNGNLDSLSRTIALSELLEKSSRDPNAVLKRQMSDMYPAEQLAYLFHCGHMTGEMALGAVEAIKSTIAEEEYEAAVSVITEEKHFDEVYK